MANRTLKPLWPLNQLDETGLSTTRLFLLLLISGLVLASCFGLFAYDRVPPGYYPPDDQGRFFVFALPVVSACTNIAVVLLLARSTEQSLLKLVRLDPALEGCLLPPSRQLVVVSFLLTIPIYLALLMFFASIYDTTLTGYVVLVLSRDPVIWVSNFVTYPIWISTTGYFIAVIVGQFLALRQIALKLQITLLEIQRYNPISEPFVRLVIVTAVILSIPQLGSLANTLDEVGQRFTFLLTLITLLILGSLAVLYLVPVWILRSRIRDEKQAQIDLISAALSGNTIAVDKIIALSPDAPATNSDLLTRQMFVESRWEWPIASHVQQLIVFGLLPPLTWVLAAVIENLLY